MQIHELPAGSPASGVQFAGDTGSQTQKIDYDALADAILNKLTTKTFDIKSESQTIIAALNALGDASKQDVANDLVTTAAGLVLDARQGKVLNDKYASQLNNGSSGSVDIKSYNSTSNFYVFPSDGYVTVDSGSGATAGTYIRYICKASNGLNAALNYMNVTGSYQSQSVYVKKGMYGYLQGTNATNAYSITFTPLDL